MTLDNVIRQIEERIENCNTLITSAVRSEDWSLAAQIKAMKIGYQNSLKIIKGLVK